MHQHMLHCIMDAVTITVILQFSCKQKPLNESSEIDINKIKMLLII